MGRMTLDDFNRTVYSSFENYSIYIIIILESEKML